MRLRHSREDPRTKSHGQRMRVRTLAQKGKCPQALLIPADPLLTSSFFVPNICPISISYIHIQPISM